MNAVLNKDIFNTHDAPPADQAAGKTEPDGVTLTEAERKKAEALKEPLNKSLDKLRTNGKRLILFVVSLSNHERNQLNQRLLKRIDAFIDRHEPLLVKLAK